MKQIWRHGEPGSSDAPAVLRELVRYATLAPSSHNTQCWKFALGDLSVSILPDDERRCPMVDPDDHHLFVSLGCAAENLVQAALAMGFRGETVFNTGKNESLEISLVRAPQVRTPLFEAIPRQMRDPAWVRELKDWIRFNEGQAVRQGDGLFSGCSGNPTAPGWLGGLMFDLFFDRKDRE